MIKDVSGLYFLDGVDMWKAYGLTVRMGSADFLAMAKKKESITHDWPDKHGLDVDLSQIFLTEKVGTLECMIVTNSRDEFFTKFESFKARLLQPGLRRLTIAAHANRSYFIYYMDMTQYRQVESLKLDNARMVAHTFNLVVCEPEPQINYVDTYLAVEDGGFLIV